MNLITRCPACSTMFRVVADQLRISEGWVRCGHCAEVFDAQAHLQDPRSVLPTSMAPPQPPALAADAEPTQTPVARSRRWRGPATPTSADPLSQAPTGRPSASQVPEPAMGFMDTPLTHPGALDEVVPNGVVTPTAAEPIRAVNEAEVSRSKTGDWRGQGKPDQEPTPASAPNRADSTEPEGADVAVQAVAAEPAPSFLLRAQKEQRARSPWRRVAWGFLSLVLLCFLLLQAAVSERNRLAAAQPQSLAVLTPLCEALKCVIGPVREISAIRIDSSTFNKIRGDLYRFAFTVSSAADLPLAAPHMELTLTDEQDRVLARRVLTAADLPGSPDVMPPRGQWSGQWTVSVVSAELDGRVAGYRLLAFYP